jgi:Ser-tRNA(Ala) deacylase AlaX
MESTKLVYMEDMHTQEGDARVLEVGDQEDRKYVVLDQTILYAQGGGQPADHGVIKSGGAAFSVSDVRFKDGIVYHYGEYTSGALSVGDAVAITVDAERRQLHKRLHSAAHVLDMVVDEMGLPWVPGKGYHFPDGPYVEYAGSLDGVDVEDLKTKMEARCNEIIAQDAPTSIKFVSKDELAQYCRHVPDNLPEGKPIRVVLYGTFGVPCGGTHVAHLGEIGHETIRKLKVEKGNVKVGYDVSRA